MKKENTFSWNIPNFTMHMFLNYNWKHRVKIGVDTSTNLMFCKSRLKFNSETYHYMGFHCWCPHPGGQMSHVSNTEPHCVLCNHHRPSPAMEHSDPLSTSHTLCNNHNKHMFLLEEIRLNIVDIIIKHMIGSGYNFSNKSILIWKCHSQSF